MTTAPIVQGMSIGIPPPSNLARVQEEYGQMTPSHNGTVVTGDEWDLPVGRRRDKRSVGCLSLFQRSGIRLLVDATASWRGCYVVWFLQLS